MHRFEEPVGTGVGEVRAERAPDDELTRLVLRPRS